MGQVYFNLWIHSSPHIFIKRWKPFHITTNWHKMGGGPVSHIIEPQITFCTLCFQVIRCDCVCPLLPDYIIKALKWTLTVDSYVHSFILYAWFDHASSKTCSYSWHSGTTWGKPGLHFTLVVNCCYVLLVCVDSLYPGYILVYLPYKTQHICKFETYLILSLNVQFLVNLLPR